VQFDWRIRDSPREVAQSARQAPIVETRSRGARCRRPGPPRMDGTTSVLRAAQELQASEASLSGVSGTGQIVDVDGSRHCLPRRISNLSARLLEVRQRLPREDCLPAGHAGGWTRGKPAWRSAPARRTKACACPGGPGDGLQQQAVADSRNATGCHILKCRWPTNSPGHREISDRPRPAAVTEASGTYEAAKSEEAAIVAALNRAGQQYQQVAARSRSSRACSGPWTRIARSTTSF